MVVRCSVCPTHRSVADDLSRCVPTAGGSSGAQGGTPAPLRATGVPGPPECGPRAGPECAGTRCVGSSATTARCRSSGLVVGSRRGCRVRRPSLAALVPDVGPDGRTSRFLPAPALRLAPGHVRRPVSATPLSQCHPHGPPPAPQESYTGPEAADRGSRSRFPIGSENCGRSARGCRGVSNNSQTSHRTSTGCPQAVHRICNDRRAPAMQSARRDGDLGVPCARGVVHPDGTRRSVVTRPA